MMKHCLCVAVMLVGVAAYAKEIPPAPKVSTFAPAEDLARQADQYIASLAESVATEEDYKDNLTKIGRESNTLVVIALALELHDQENQYKPKAVAIMKAAQAVAAAKDFASVEKAVAALQQAAAGKVKADAALKWEPVASLKELMVQVPFINTKLKRYIKPKYFTKKAKNTAGYTAVIAVIGQGSIASASETKKPEQADVWCKLMAAMRDDAGAVNAAIHCGDEPAAAKAMKKLQQGCADCHKIFHPEALAETEE